MENNNKKCDCLKELDISIPEYTSLINLFNKGPELTKNEMTNILNTLKLKDKLKQNRLNQIFLLCGSRKIECDDDTMQKTMTDLYKCFV